MLQRVRPLVAACAVVGLLSAVVPAVAAPSGATCQGLAVTMLGTPGDDEIRGTNGPDVIDGRGGDDVIRGRGGDDVICGGDGNDRIFGGSGDDRIQGGPGRDTIQGGSGRDVVSGGTDADRLHGGSSGDTIRGGEGDDLIRGESGADDLSGASGADEVRGGIGNDVLQGGADSDECAGGAGIDSAKGCETPVGTEIGDRPPLRTHPGSGKVALTFDDGPDPRWTPHVLDLLAQYHVHATFFVVGYKAAQYPGLIRRMIREGHSVQNHTHSHAWLTRHSNDVVADQVATGRDEIGAAAGDVLPRCLRPPFGAISTRVTDIAAGEHQAIVMWDVDPQDWRNHDSTYVASHVLRHTGSNDIVLLHDGGGTTAGDSLVRIITGLRARGLGFASICG